MSRSLTHYWVPGMLNEPCALLDPHGRLMGQVLVCGTYALASLHVVSAMDHPATLPLETGRGSSLCIEVVRTVATDERCDVVILQAAGRPQPFSLRLADPLMVKDGDPLLIHAVVRSPDGARADFKLTTVASRVCEVVEVQRYNYRAASGQVVELCGVLVLLLDDMFAPGWSGAPVYDAVSGALYGFLHGNTVVGGGAGICLLPDANSPVWRLLRQHGKGGDVCN